MALACVESVGIAFLHARGPLSVRKRHGKGVVRGSSARTFARTHEIAMPLPAEERERLACDALFGQAAGVEEFAWVVAVGGSRAAGQSTNECARGVERRRDPAAKAADDATPVPGMCMVTSSRMAGQTWRGAPRGTWVSYCVRGRFFLGSFSLCRFLSCHV